VVNPSTFPKTPRTFTPLGITFSRALEKLQKHGVLTPLLPPSPPPDPLPPRYKANAYCKYHQTNGQNTDRCLRLKHDIQDLIDLGKIEPPRAKRPNVTTNPLLSFVSSCQYKIIEPTLSSWDPSLLITPAGEKGETDGRDMTWIRETYEIEPPPRVHMLRWDDFYDNRAESPASEKSFNLAHLPQPFDESPISSDPTDLKPLPASLWMDSDELDQYGTNDDMDFVINEEA